MKVFFIGLSLLLTQLLPMIWISDRITSYWFSNIGANHNNPILEYFNFFTFGINLILSFSLVLILFKLTKLAKRVEKSLKNSLLVISGVLMVFLFEFPIVQQIWSVFKPSETMVMIFINLHQLGELLLLSGLILFYLELKPEHGHNNVPSKNTLNTLLTMSFLSIVMLFSFHFETVNYLIMRNMSFKDFLTSSFVITAIISSIVISIIIFKTKVKENIVQAKT